LGIGTTTPLGILHLKRTADTTRMVMDGDAGQSKIITYRTAGLQRFGLYVNNTAESGSNAGSDFAVRAYSDAGTLLNTPLFIKRSTGNVGIGTTTPSSPLSIVNTIALAAGATNPSIENIAYTINNTGAQTGTATGIFLNAIETALNGMTNRLMDLQNGGVSMLRVERLGQLSSIGYSIDAARFRFNNQNYNTNFGYIQGNSNGVFSLIDNTEANFNRLQFGGTTSSFPAIKRNGAAIDFRLADDSGFTQVNASDFTIGGSATKLIINQLLLGGLNTIQFSTRMYFDGDNRGSSFGGSVSMASSNVAAAASAQLDVVSTTKGFLPPRMTNAQRLAIASPAVGLEVYCTDAVEGKYIYKSTGWTFVI
jgi:hypothetical protein